MKEFSQSWAEAAHTSLMFFWMAMWAFILGYVASSMIQIFVTEKKMQHTMGKDSLRSVGLGTFFGFINSSCSFAALATTKSLFQKGAGFISSIAFLLASTNLVIELGIIIGIFLGWQFVVGEYLGGLLLILFATILIVITRPNKLVKKARQRVDQQDEGADSDKSFMKKVQSSEAWAKVGKQFGMEWKMVWKDVTIGFTIAGIISAFVPNSFFQTLFINTGSGKQTLGFFTLLEHVLVGPLTAFLTFIGSMGNIPLAALLFGKGVSFAGIMAFIFSDLVVFPVLRINAKYYGWKMSMYIAFLLLTSLVITSLLLHYGLQIFDALPQSSGSHIGKDEKFKLNYTFYLNLAFVLISIGLVYWGYFKHPEVRHHKEMAPKSPGFERFLKYLALLCYAWLIVGIGIKIFMN